MGDEKHDTYYHIVKKLLHVDKRCRIDIQLVVSFFVH